MSKARETVETLRTVLVDGDVTNANFTGADLEIGKGGTGASSAGAARTALGLVVGTDVLAPNGSGANLTNLPAGGATSINGLSDGTNDASSVGLGTGALANDDGTTNGNTAVGTNALYTNTSGNRNTGIGFWALQFNTEGNFNTASGIKALNSNLTGNYNTASGTYALKANTTGSSNTASGMYALKSNTTGEKNTASGFYALTLNTTGSFNTALGGGALEANTTGRRNTASGYGVLKNNTTGNNNTSSGKSSLNENTTGYQNTACGMNSLYENTTGANNTATGYQSLYSITTGTKNTASGYSADATSATVSNEFTLGGSQISNLRCNVTSISSLSDRRDKTNITDLPESAGLGIINALRPVTFNWDRREWYDNNTPDGSKVMPDWRRWKANSGLKYGFIAQEVQATIAGEKCMADSMIITDENLDRLEFAPQHLLTNAIKAIQQLSTENEALKIRLTALENA